ncbi:MAG: 3-octaprenyl-4-hydroxybenzoate carboxy-lyase [Rhodospirillaceae bacterium]|nr:MAG: 3-octaprenyl-4-hydroxybenzoate carboxy-lyase [Rhodospirillaceae bacterium]
MTDQAPIIVAITGASGAIYGVETLRALKDLNIPTHLVVTESGARTLNHETGLTLDDARALATTHHANKNIGASIASGSFRTAGMIVAPCSIKTLSGIANSFADNLVIRAADVCLKERRPVILMVRETPLHKGHLDLMSRACDIGCTIAPPMPAFYNKPESLQDLVRHTVGRTLDLFDIKHSLVKPWAGDLK